MDIIQQAIEGIGLMLAKILRKDIDTHELVMEMYASDSEAGAVVTALFYAGDYNGAENLLFSELSKNFDLNLYLFGLDFYQKMNALTDEQLIKGNFTRDEIASGVRDLRKLLEGISSDEDISGDNE